MKKIIFSIGILLLLLVSIPVTVFLVQQQQDIRNRASTPQGQATVSLSPARISIPAGQTITVSVSFKTGGIAISAIAIRLSYPYSGTTPEISVDPASIKANPSLTENSWACPLVKAVTPKDGIVNVDIACATTNPQGFSTSTDTQLATFTLKAERMPATNPTILKFDPVESKITKKADSQDTLLTPTSTGEYTITASSQGGSSGSPTATPIPTAPSITSPTATPTPTGAPTTRTQTSTSAPQASQPTLPPLVPVTLASAILGKTLTDPRPTFRGKASPGAKVTIVIESNPITGTVYADTYGNWSWTPTEDIPQGSHKITITAVDEQNRTTQTFATFTMAPAQLPVTATSWPTLIIAGAGMFLLVLGGFLFYNAGALKSSPTT